MDVQSLSIYVAIFVGVFTTTGLIKYLTSKESVNVKNPSSSTSSSSLNENNSKNKSIEGEKSKENEIPTTKKNYTVIPPKPKEISTTTKESMINSGEKESKVEKSVDSNVKIDNNPTLASLSSSSAPKITVNSEESKKEDSVFKMPIAPSKKSSVNKPTVTIEAPKSSPNEPQTGTATMLTNNKFQKRNKVALEPGHSPLDWAKLTMSGKDLAGTGGRLLRVTTEELAKHNKKDDLWMMIRGKVYNCTAYVKFHPGGVPELMRAAGKDGTTLFDEKHAWVNPDATLRGCLVGFWVPE